MIRPVDLHVHSTKSDGTMTPAQLVDYAIQKGLKAFALTDHDTTEGLTEALDAARGKDIEVIPGIEFSTEYEGRDIHILGLYIQTDSRNFMDYLTQFQNSRDVRNQKMCQRLQEHGVHISYEELQERFPEAIITRSHYAGLLLEKGYVKSRTEAFERYVGDHAPCYIPREKVTPCQAVSLIQESGGLSFLAHPTLYRMSNSRLDLLVSRLKESGLSGIEAVYSAYSISEERQMRCIARKYDLLISGGSDFHGSAKPGLDLATGYGRLFIPSDILDTLKERLSQTMCDII